MNPTTSPTMDPTFLPTSPPTTRDPSTMPTLAPSMGNIYISRKPTFLPTTAFPTTTRPTTREPTNFPTREPTNFPTREPTNLELEQGTETSPSNIFYLLVGFCVSAFIVLICLLLLCIFRIRKSRADTVKKLLTEMTLRSHRRVSYSDSINEFQTYMNEDVFNVMGRDEPQAPYRNLNEISSYSYKRPILGEPNVQYMQRNNLPTMANPQQTHITPGNGAHPVLLQHPVHSFDPNTGQFVMQMIPQTSSQQMYPARVPGMPVQYGVSPQHIGFRPQLGESSVSLAHSYINTPKEGGTNIRTSISRGNEGRSSHRTSYGETQRDSARKQFRYLENSQGDLDRHKNYMASTPSAVERRSTKKKKKKKPRNSKKHKIQKSISRGRRHSSSDDEIVQSTTHRSVYTLKTLSGDPGVPGSDDETSSSWRGERIASQRTVSARTPRSVSVRKLRQTKKNPVSKEDIVRMVSKELELSRLRVGKSSKKPKTSQTAGRGSNRSRGKVDSDESVSESLSKSPTTVQQRDDTQVKGDRFASKTITKTLNLEVLSTSSSSDDYKASSDCEEDTLPVKNPVKTHRKYDSVVMVNNKGGGIDLGNVNMDIPKTFNEFQKWQKSMLDNVAEKYFDKEFLDGGTMPPDVTTMNWPTRVDSPTEAESQQSACDSSSESPESPVNVLGSAKQPILSG